MRIKNNREIVHDYIIFGDATKVAKLFRFVMNRDSVFLTCKMRTFTGGLRVRVGAGRLRKFKFFDYGNVW